MPAPKKAAKKAPAKKPAAKGKKKAEAAKAPTTLEGKFDLQLQTLGLSSALELADKFETDYTVVTTGFPGLNKLIGGDKIKHCGWPRFCHAEIYSEVEGVGKTTISLKIGVAWQLAGMRVGIVDIEPSITPAYLRMLGYITDKKEAEARGLYAVRLMQPKVKAEDCETEMIYVDKVLDTVAVASNIFDLLIIDSVDALVSEADAAKNTETGGDQMGGVSKPIKAHFRKNSKRRASCIWINHKSQGFGQYAKAYTTGGKAIPRYSSIRLQLDRVDFLRENKDSDPIGFITKVTTIKNRLGAIGWSTLLYYIFGEGFSTNYDYFLTAQKLGLITKAGAWNYVGPDKDHSKLNVQGVFNMYKSLRDEHPDLFDELKKIIDGEDTTVEAELSEMTAEERLLLEAEVDLDEAEDENDGPAPLANVVPAEAVVIAA